MSPSDREVGSAYRQVIEGIAERSATLAEKRAETRHMAREEPDWHWARTELAEETGELREYNWILRTLWRRYNAEGFAPEEFGRWLWRLHKRSNVRRSEQTGNSARAAKGAHHASHVALTVLREQTGVEYEDYAATADEEFVTDGGRNEHPDQREVVAIDGLNLGHAPGCNDCETQTEFRGLQPAGTTGWLVHWMCPECDPARIQIEDLPDGAEVITKDSEQQTLVTDGGRDRVEHRVGHEARR